MSRGPNLDDLTIPDGAFVTAEDFERRLLPAPVSRSLAQRALLLLVAGLTAVAAICALHPPKQQQIVTGTFDYVSTRCGLFRTMAASEPVGEAPQAPADSPGSAP